MVQGSPVPEVVQWIVIRMGPLLSTQDIANYTDLSERKVRHILAHFRNTGDVNAPKRSKDKVTRSLQEDHVEVCFTMCHTLFC